MKPRPNPVQPPAPIRLKPRSTQGKAFIVGGFAIAAVFVCLEMSRPAPRDTVAEAPPEAVVKSAVKTPAAASGTIVPEAGGEPEEIAGNTPEAPPTPAISPAGEAPEAAPSGPVLIGFSAETPLTLAGLDAGRDAAKERDSQLLARAIDEGAWDGYRDFLAKSIGASLGPAGTGSAATRYSGVWDQPALYRTLLRWETLGKFPPSDLTKFVHDSYTGGFLTWLCNDVPAMEEFLLTIQPEDNGGRVLKFLMDARENTEDKWDKYFNLALACAVVFDNEVRIPNPVGGEYGAKAVVAPMERFLWFVTNNEKGKLAAPVHHSTARDLVWVVCAPVSTSELDWAVKKLHLNRKRWGSAYGMIEYLMERAVKGLNPYKEYTFAEILKEGGICGDQSYFCANTARANGIPAMTFGGETSLGPHAWVGMKIASDEWTTGIGRIGGVSKGTTGNPQTGKSITEQEVQLWGDRYHQSSPNTLAVARHLWLADWFDSAKREADHDETVRLANKLGPSFVETWTALFDQFKARMKMTGDPAEPDNLEDWQWFAKEMRRQFKDNPRMAGLAARAESEFIFPYGDAGDIDRQLLRERRRIARESGEQVDLIAGSLKRQADLISKRGDPASKEEIGRLYDSALRKYGANITGFKIMAEDYFSFFRDDPQLARKVARDIELAFMRVVDTGSKEWFRANTESSIYKMICSYYRAAGDEARAVKLEKRYEILLKHAERGAL